MTNASKKHESGAMRGLIAAACIASLAACSNNDDGGDSSGGGAGGLSPDNSQIAADTVLTVQVLDATGSPVDDATVEVTADGADVIPAAQELASTGTGNAGVISYIPNPFSNDATIQVRASKDGFTSNNLPLTLSSGSSSLEIIVITEESNGEVLGVGLASSSGNILQNDVTAFAEPSSASENNDNADKGQTFVRVPSNTTATTRDGTPLGNNLTVNLVHYDGDQSSSLAAFPGGFSVNISNPDDLVNSGYQTIDGGDPVDADGLIFETLGFAAIEIVDDQGNQAKNLGSPIDVTIVTKSNFQHPTAQPARMVQAGDTVPIWSFDEVTGEWQFDQMGTIVDNGSGRLIVNFSTTHLSYFNLDWARGDSCDITVSFTNADGSTEIPSFQGSVSRDQGGIDHPGGFYKIFSTQDNEVTFQNMPIGVPLSINNTSTHAGNSIVLNPSSFSCSDSGTTTATSSVTVGTGVATSTVSITPVSFCSNETGDDVQDLSVGEGTVVQLFTSSSVHIARTNSDGVAQFLGVPAGVHDVSVGRSASRSSVAVGADDVAATLRLRQICVVSTGGSGSGG